MERISRRSVLALGVAAAAAPLAGTSWAVAQTSRYGPDDGEELAPGVRRVDLGDGEAAIGEYATVAMRDMIFEAGVSAPPVTMPNDMVCHMLEGELLISQDGRELGVIPENGVWTCRQGMEVAATNQTDAAAVMRITDLLPA